MLGTMHSAVISRDEGKVKELILKCENGQLNQAVIDSLDEDGYSPLHYASILRLPGIVRVLSASGANCGVEDSRGMTPLHWAALQLDDQALSILSDYAADIDEFDHLGRTPFYLACVEGRDVAGQANSELLSLCIATLLRHGPDTDFRDEEGYTILHYLAASWLHGPLKKILDHTSKSNVYKISVTTGMNALHYACYATPLRRMVGVGSWILNNAGNKTFSGIECERDPQRDMQPEELVLGEGVETIKVLLRAGNKYSIKLSYILKWTALMCSTVLSIDPYSATSDKPFAGCTIVRNKVHFSEIPLYRSQSVNFSALYSIILYSFLLHANILRNTVAVTSTKPLHG